MGLVALADLTPHPLNYEIYGDTDYENMSDAQAVEFMQLVESIKTNGLLHPLIVDQDLRIISGERRFNAYKYLGLKEIEVIQYEYKDDLKRINHLIEENRYRVKTNMQLIKEGTIKEKLIEANKKNILKEKGEKSLRDVIGIDLGMSGKTYEKGKKVLKVIEELRDDGDIVAAKELEKKANKSIHGALKEKQENDFNSDTWWRPFIQKMLNIMESKIASIEKNVKSNEPSSFIWFLSTIKRDIEKYRTWLDDETMKTCPVCQGTMYALTKEHCKVCIRGRVGFYELEEMNVRTTEIPDDSISQDS